jgi:hypothetical protein
MCRYSNTTVSYILNKNEFADSDIIETQKDRLGFNVAFGLIDLATYKSVEGIEQTGSFKAKASSFNVNLSTHKSLPIQKCT